MSFQPYYYVISRPPTKKARRAAVQPESLFPASQPNRSKTVIAKMLLVTGLLILGWVAYPLASFQFFESRKLAQDKFLIPGGPLQIQQTTTLAAEGSETTDYTHVSNWFPEGGTVPTVGEKISYYSLSIPKLKINQASVALSGEDLSKSLVHYGGTALPGRPGGGVVFGHSILPQFYNPKNYMAIFSTLHTLKNGDQIIVTYDGVTYQYQVIDMFEVQPTDISVLDQSFDDKYLTLITCTPPGTYLRRLVVKAKLVPHE